MVDSLYDREREQELLWSKVIISSCHPQWAPANESWTHDWSPAALSRHSGLLVLTIEPQCAAETEQLDKSFNDAKCQPKCDRHHVQDPLGS